MAEPWRYRSAKIGWTKAVILPLPRAVTVTLRAFHSGSSWSAAVYRARLVIPSALMPGTRSRHESKEAAQRKLLAWVRQHQSAGDAP